MGKKKQVKDEYAPAWMDEENDEKYVIL